jgi:hypothetical protein
LQENNIQNAENGRVIMGEWELDRAQHGAACAGCDKKAAWYLTEAGAYQPLRSLYRDHNWTVVAFPEGEGEKFFCISARNSFRVEGECAIVAKFMKSNRVVSV